jgi:predicted  nucleic acid-binding Zn-ribbon protein
MRGFCSGCKRYVGDKEEYDVLFTRDNFPICSYCHSFVDLFDTGDDLD